jgi:hypothetical protein
MITQEEIVVIAQSVLGTMLHIEAMPDQQVSEVSGTEAAFTGCVQITGNWQGAVLVQGTGFGIFRVTRSRCDRSRYS